MTCAAVVFDRAASDRIEIGSGSEHRGDLDRVDRVKGAGHAPATAGQIIVREAWDRLGAGAVEVDSAAGDRVPSSTTRCKRSRNSDRARAGKGLAEVTERQVSVIGREHGCLSV